MATNLISEIADVLSPSIVSRVASALGLNQTSTQKAVVAAVPALLANEPTAVWRISEEYDRCLISTTF